MACTTKSILPQLCPSTSNTASMLAGSVTSQWPSRRPLMSLASGSTRFFSASPCQVSAISAPAAWQAFAMPQAIERLLATPRTTPRLPCISEECCAIGSSISSKFWVHQHLAPVQSKIGAIRPHLPQCVTSGIVWRFGCYADYRDLRAFASFARANRSPSRMSAFRQSVEAMIPALRRYARALARDADIADDLVQDTLVRALRSERLFLGGDVRSWLYTILTNLNKNRRRSLARRPQFMPLLDNNPDASGTEAEGRDIAKALATLVEEQRAVLLLVMLEGLSYREVADIQGVPIGTVMSRLARARAHVKASIEGERPALRRVK